MRQMMGFIGLVINFQKDSILVAPKSIVPYHVI